jgi:uncharacterized membrane protein (Fun14 family)
MDASVMVVQVAAGLTMGALIGLALKKAAQLILTVLGFFLMGVVGLAYLGVITMNWEGLASLLSRLLGWLGVQLSDMMSFISSVSVFGVSILVGMVLTNAIGTMTIENTKNLVKKGKFVKKKEKTY